MLCCPDQRLHGINTFLLCRCDTLVPEPFLPLLGDDVCWGSPCGPVTPRPNGLMLRGKSNWTVLPCHPNCPPTLGAEESSGFALIHNCLLLSQGARAVGALMSLPCACCSPPPREKRPLKDIVSTSKCVDAQPVLSPYTVSSSPPGRVVYVGVLY